MNYLLIAIFSPHLMTQISYSTWEECNTANKLMYQQYIAFADWRDERLSARSAGAKIITENMPEIYCVKVELGAMIK
jgi:hypothetical protein